MNDPSLTLYQQGALALKQARYPDAIASLEQFCQTTTQRQSKPFLQAQMWLIQAYHKDHKDLHAIALCEQLIKSDVPQVRQWATQALNKLMTASPPSATGFDDPAPPGPPPPLSADAQNPFAPSVDTAPAGVTAPLPARPAVDKNPFARSGRNDHQLSSRSPSRRTLEADEVVPTDIIHPMRQRSAPRSVTRSSSHAQAVKKSQPKDLSQQIMSAIAHGSVSMLASILLFILFSDSILANGLGILRFAVPLLIFFTTSDRLVKDNAREALNYTITCLILFIPLIFAVIALSLILALMPPIGGLLWLILGAYLITFSFYPVVATILCLTQADRVFEYPDWLILHLL